MVACEGVVSGTCEYAREKTVPCWARESRFGVRPRLEPRNPMRSARVVSSVMRIMLSGFAKLETQLIAGRKRHRSHRHKNIQSPPSIFWTAQKAILHRLNCASPFSLDGNWFRIPRLDKEERGRPLLAGQCMNARKEAGEKKRETSSQGASSLRRRLESLSSCFSLSMKSLGSMSLPTLSTPESEEALFYRTRSGSCQLAAVPLARRIVLRTMTPKAGE